MKSLYKASLYCPYIFSRKLVFLTMQCFIQYSQLNFVTHWTIYTCDWCQRWLLLFWHFVAPLFHLYTHYFYFGGVYCWDCCWWELCQTTKSTSLYNVYTFSEVFVNGKDLSNNKSHLFLQYIHIFRGAYCWVTICEDPKIITATSVDNLIYT